MNVKDLQALIVLRNHAQALLNGVRADLKMSKEEKSSLMNGLKKVDEVFLKKFEASVEASALTTVARTWTSTDSEESVLSRVMSSTVATATSDSSGKAVESTLDTVKAAAPTASVDTTEATVKKSPWTTAKDTTTVQSMSTSESLTKTDAAKTDAVKSKRSFKRA